MRFSQRASFSACFALCLVCSPDARAENSLPAKIDELIAAKAAGQTASPRADDAEFLRRACLDFVGRIPSIVETRTFLADPATDKRINLIDKLLASPEFPRRMQELFHVMLMERRGDDPAWSKYLQDSFAANKPWDQLAREMLSPNPDDEQKRAAAYFLTKRLEHYGENPIDYPGLTRDVGRLFVGKDLQCAQCHDHLFIDDYKQVDFQGLHAIFANTILRTDTKFPSVGEKPLTKKVAFMSVFEKIKKETGPVIPGKGEAAIPVLAPGDEYLTKPDKKTKSPGVLRFSPLAKLAQELPAADNDLFARNMANRLWFVLLGRGIVHPLDLHHAANPPSHPELLELLGKEFAAHQFDMKWLLREIALSETYQRSSLLPEGAAAPEPAKFLAGIEKRVSAEQLMWSMLQATGEIAKYQLPADKAGDEAEHAALAKKTEELRLKFVKAFANPPLDPEVECTPSLQAALFLLNDATVLNWLKPAEGNLVYRLTRFDDPSVAAEELYLSVLSRPPSAEETDETVAFMKANADKAKACQQLAWALLASTEFCVNH